MPLYARNLTPPTVISRALAGVAPMIDLSLGYNQANTSPLLKTIVSRIGELKFGGAS
jgi:LysR family hca operon transcriptional activator